MESAIQNQETISRAGIRDPELDEITLKSNSTHVSADDVVHIQNKCERLKCLTYWGGDGKNCNKHHKNDKISFNLKKINVHGYLKMVMKWKWQAYM